MGPKQAFGTFNFMLVRLDRLGTNSARIAIAWLAYSS